MNSGIKIWFSAVQLARLGGARAIDFPRNEKSTRGKAKRLGWDSREVPCKGGRRGYMTEFMPPDDVLDAITLFLKKNPDFFDDVYVPESISKPYPTSTTTHLITGTENHTRLTANSHSGNQIRVNNFVTVPKYDLPVTSGGRDLAIHSTQIVDHLAFKQEWLEDMSLNTNCLALISVKDDSMEPTLRSGDLILTDTSRLNIENNSIYVLQVNNALIVKRIQCKVNGGFIVKSDNPVYGEEELDALTAKSLPIVGKVVWYGRRV